MTAETGANDVGERRRTVARREEHRNTARVLRPAEGDVRHPVGKHLMRKVSDDARQRLPLRLVDRQRVREPQRELSPRQLGTLVREDARHARKEVHVVRRQHADGDMVPFQPDDEQLRPVHQPVGRREVAQEDCDRSLAQLQQPLRHPRRA